MGHQFYADIYVKVNWGYEVYIYKDDTLLEEYSAGDSFWDSQIYGTGNLSYDTLLAYANKTASEMLEEHGSPKPYEIILGENTE